MGYVVRMPQMGMEMDRGEVVSWESEEGETVAEDELLALVESEKATNEVQAREDGTLRRIIVEEGGTVEPGTPIGIVADPGEDLASYETEIDSDVDSGLEESATGETDAEASSTGGAATADERSGSPAAAASVDGSGGGGAAVAASTRPDADGRDPEEVRATPGARRRADEEGVDITAVEGTGPQGVVTEDDVENHALATATSDSATDGRSLTVEREPIQTPPPEGVDASPGARQLAGQVDVDLSAIDGSGPQDVVVEGDVRQAVETAATKATPERDAGPGASRTVREARELSGVQQTVSDRLGESYRNAVHVTTKRTFDASTLQAVGAAAEAAGADVSISDLLVKAVGAELAARPEFNALFEDGTHKLVEEVNVGVAVDVEEGLVTPVVPDVTDKSLEEVAAVRSDLTRRALDGEYTSEDLAGGTFTITNLGPFGVDSFDPVINPPEVAILGVGRVRDDGTMTLSLSFDHRVLNGADAARFLGGLVDTLTDPLTLADFFEADVLAADGVDVTLAVDADQ